MLPEISAVCCMRNLAPLPFWLPGQIGGLAENGFLKRVRLLPVYAFLLDLISVFLLPCWESLIEGLWAILIISERLSWNVDKLPYNVTPRQNF